MTKNDKNREPAFEEALEQLEVVVEKMEAGDLSLDKMIDCFERGTTLANLCDKKLKALEKKIQILVNETENGGEWSDFDQSSERTNATIATPQSIKPTADTDSESDLLF